MDALLSKAGGFLFAKRAEQEFSSLGDDVNSLQTSVEEGAKRLFNRIRGKMQLSLPELLQANGLPKGIFPKSVTHYELVEATGKITIFVPAVCEVRFRDSSIVRYATKITASISQGSLTNIEGLKTKVVLVWLNVTSISTDQPKSDKLHFGIGFKKSRPYEAYDALRDGVEVDEF